MKKKLLAGLLATAMVASLCACSDDKKDTDATGEETTAAVADSDSGDKDTKDSNDSNDGDTDAPVEETTEETTEETEPAVEIPEGYEEITFTNSEFGVEISFAIPGAAEETYEDKYTSYENGDHDSDDNYIISYSYNVYAADLSDEDWERKVGDYEVVDSEYPAILNAYSDTLQYLTFYGGEFLNAKYIVQVTCSYFQEKADSDIFAESVKTVAKTMRIKSLGTNEFLDEDGNYICTGSDYAKIKPDMKIDGKDLTAYLFVESGESATPYFEVDFDSEAGDHVKVLARNGYGGTIYASRSEDEDYRACTISGYPALCTLSNSFGKLSAHYIVLCGYEDRESKDGDKYEENFEIYILLDGDYSDDFLKDLVNGTDHPELDERLDSYATGYMDAVIYTPGEGSTPVEKAS